MSAFFNRVATQVYKSLEDIELVMIELSVRTFASEAVFPGGQIPTEYLEIFKLAGLCKSQWVRFSLWYRYPLLRHLAPSLSGYKWHAEMIRKNYETLEKMVAIHRANWWQGANSGSQFY